jgi:hypothetical protein
MHLKSQMYQQMEDAVPAHINDERSTCYNICKWCMGDHTVLLDEEVNHNAANFVRQS